MSEESVRQKARTAWSLGLVAIILCVVAPCAGYISLLAALPLGWIAMAQARRVLEDGPDEASEAYARTAQITGVTSLVWSSLMLLAFIGFVLLYAGLIAALLQMN